MKLHPLRSLRILSALSFFGGVLLLFLPIVWMEIGPMGKAYYGPTVPDIYIYGGYITGKDLQWAPIYGAMIFQRTVILVGIGLAAGALGFTWNSRFLFKFCLWITTFLLALFPVWISAYAGHVINNSDGAAADLTVHYGSGMYVYACLVVLNIATHWLRRRRVHIKPLTFQNTPGV